MKNFGIFIISIFVLSFFSCKKDKKVDSPTNQNVTLTNNIKYHNINPDIMVTPAVSRYTTAYGCNAAPLPLDSATYYYLDVDSDAVYDFKFETKITYVALSASSPCSNYDFQTSVYSTSPNYVVGSSFANSGIYSTSYNVMDTNATINGTSVSFSNGFFVAGLTRSPNGFPGNISLFSGDKFIAFKKTSAIGSNYGWIKLKGNNSSSIVVKDFALNLAANTSIFCGQMN